MVDIDDYSRDIVLAKITAPRPTPISIERFKPYRRLLECLAWNIVFIEAPVGSGKTAFLGESYRHLNEDSGNWRAAWLTVDDADDRDRLCRHVLAALRSIWPEFDEDELVALYRTDPKSYTIALSNLLLRAAQGQPMKYVLFVDELTEAEPTAVSEFLDAVGEYFPGNIHIVVSGNYTLWRNLDIRFRDSVSIFPSNLLDFSIEEVEKLIGNAAPAFDTHELSVSLWTLTQGWATGVRSYVNALSQGQVEPSSVADEKLLSTLVSRFFTVSILNRLPSELSSFMLESALVEKMRADLCDHLTGRNDAQVMLRELLKRGCFIAPCPESGGWYRYQHLFLQWLREKMLQLRTDQLRNLSQAASDWYESHDMPAEAAKYMLAAGDSDFVESLVNAAGFTSDRGAESYFKWICRVPAADIPINPQMSLQVVWGYVCCGRAGDALHWLDVFERGISAQGSGFPDGNEHVDVSIIVHHVRTKCLELQGRYAEAIEADKKLLELDDSEIPLSQRCLVTHTVAEAYARVGELDLAMKNYLQAEAMAELANSFFFTALCRLGMIWIHIFRGNLKAAQNLCSMAIKDCPKDFTLYGALQSALSYVFVEMDELDEAADSIKRARRVLSSTRNVDMLYEADSILAHCLSATGHDDEAFRSITKTALLVDEHKVPRGVVPFVYLTQARVACAMGYLPEARRAVSKLLAKADPADSSYVLMGKTMEAAIDGREGNRVSVEGIMLLIEQAHTEGLGMSELELRILASVCYARMGCKTDALMQMTRALQLGSEQAAIRPFLREGDTVRTLLHEIIDVRKSGGSVRPFARKVLRAFKEAHVGEDAFDPLGSQKLRFDLTAREYEVLELLDVGMSRSEIGETLCISLNTVKSHIGSIYDKLGVNNRMDAFRIIRDNADMDS